ncbi:MAG: selenocysteine-specific translation elongation factor [Desulfotomaculales bacterium]
MKYSVVGTAGHVDHGKTALIKALTGIDTDRLKEEKERGISIELGFAYLDLPSGIRVGIVDVPGHERFIKNMLAGVGGIDLVLLVIAADEGVMPQTREHLDIIHLLGIQRGIVVISKIDLVDEQWVELVKEDVADCLKGTSLAQAPVIPVSAFTGEGLKELVSTLDRMVQEVPPRDTEGPARLPVDRVFSVTGFGTVLTGTLLSGHIKVGDVLQIMPGRVTTRVRTIQVHKRKVDEAYAGQRVAINVPGVEIDQVRRGDVLITPDSLPVTRRLDASLTLLKSADRPLKNRARVRFHLGAAEIMARVILLELDELIPGNSAYAQIQLEGETVAAYGDTFVIRSYSPTRTIGGGKVLQPSAPHHKRFRPEVIATLATLERGSPFQLLEEKLARVGNIVSVEEIAQAMGWHPDKVKELGTELVRLGRARSLTVDGKEHLVAGEVWDSWRAKIREVVSRYHREYPLREGFPREELRSRYFGNLSAKVFNTILRLLAGEGAIELGANVVALPGFRAEPTAEQKVIVDRIVEAYRAGGLQPPSWESVVQTLGLTTPALDELQAFLTRTGRLVKVTEELFFHPDNVERARQLLEKALERADAITVGEARIVWQTSRKYAVPLLELFDNLRVTRRIGDKRVLVKAKN